MNRLTKIIFANPPPGGVFSDTVIENLLNGLSKEAIASAVYRAVKAGDILTLKKGLYCLDEKFIKGPRISRLVIAQKLYHPSYISFESALSYYGLIPEKVTVIISGTSRRKKEFNTPLGTFRYFSIPCSPLFVGVSTIEENGHNVLMASPLRAIADLVYKRKEIPQGKKGINFLIESFRIEIEGLSELDFSFSEEILHSFKDKRVKSIIEELSENYGNL